MTAKDVALDKTYSLSREEDFPDPINSGVHEGVQSDQNEQFQQVTNAEYRPYAEQLAAFGEEGVSGLGGRVGFRLNIAAFLQVEKERQEARQEVKVLRAKLDESKDNEAALKIENAGLKSTIREATNATWICTFLYLLGTIFVSFGVNFIGNPISFAFFIPGTLVILAAFIMQAIYSKVKNGN